MVSAATDGTEEKGTGLLRSQLRVPVLMEAILTGIHSSETSDLTRTG